jgi:hypothetical protein
MTEFIQVHALAINMTIDKTLNDIEANLKLHMNLIMRKRSEKERKDRIQNSDLLLKG